MKLLRRSSLSLPARHRPAVLAALATTVALAGLAAGGGAASATTTAAVAAAPGQAPAGKPTASLSTCHVAADLSDRYAIFAAQMVATPATQQMSLRLGLYEHTPGNAGYHLISGVPGFGVWETSSPGVGVFNYSQEVTSLVAPASFRVQVAYRWLDADHKVIKRATRTTVSCAQPAQLANLVAGGISVTRGTVSGTATYDVTVRNDGPVAAGPFTVGLSIDGVAVTGQQVAGLNPLSRTAVEFTGPACAASGTMTVAVDPGHAVGESTRTDDTRTVACS
jgi:CARDB